MTNLSPAAKDFVKAFDDRYELLGPFEDNWQEQCIAAVLCAVADEVAPFEAMDIDNCWYEKRNPVREKILAIATELKNHK